MFDIEWFGALSYLENNKAYSFIGNEVNGIPTQVSPLELL
jgi:hypothetical protein